MPGSDDVDHEPLEPKREVATPDPMAAWRPHLWSPSEATLPNWRETSRMPPKKNRLWEFLVRALLRVRRNR